MFKKTVHITRHGKDYLGTECCVSCLADCIKSIAQNDSISVCGLPGSAKNMLLQLAFFNMTDAFVNGESDLLPCYIAVNCFEKEDYGEQDIVAFLITARVQAVKWLNGVSLLIPSFHDRFVLHGWGL